MAVIIYKGRQYEIQHKVSYADSYADVVFYCHTIQSHSLTRNAVNFSRCYQVNRKIVNNPLKIMRDFLLVGHRIKIEMLETDYKINLDKGGDSRESAE